MAATYRHTRILLQSSVSCGLGLINFAARAHCWGNSLEQRRTWDFYSLVYLLKGSGQMRSGDHPAVRCRAGDLLFLFPGIPHGYGPAPGEAWHELHLIFHGPVFDLWRQEGLLSPERYLRHLPRLSRWLPQLEALAGPRLPETPEGMLERICLLQKFLCDTLKKSKLAGDPLPWLERAKRRLMEAPRAPLPAVARSLGLSYETFRKDFTHHMGCSPGHYRATRLIDRARVLIGEFNLGNKEIAQTLGFCDEFHFSRRFRQVTGKSASDFRHSLSGERSSSR